MFWLRLSGRYGSGFGAALLALVALAAAVVAIPWYLAQRSTEIAQQQERWANEGSNRATDRETLRRESQKPFIETQLALYLEAVDSATQVAAAGPIDSLDERGRSDLIAAKAKFRQLYNGKMAAAETASVAAAMMKYDAALADMENCHPTPDNRACEQPHNTLVFRAICLAHTVRASIEQTWGPPGFDNAMTPPPSFPKPTTSPESKADPYSICDDGSAR